jgi:hypothetical protein
MRMLSRLVLISIAVGVVAAAGFVVIRRVNDDGWSKAENRVWIERMPRTPRDMTKKIVFIHKEGERVGAVVHSSEFRMFLDMFHWFRRDDGRVRMAFPQDQKERMPYVRAWQCKGEAPAPFELCLEAKEGDQRRLFYSMEEWVIRGANDVTARGAPWNQLGGVEPDEGAPESGDASLDAGDDTPDDLLF